MPFLVGLVHREAWSILVVAAPRLRKMREKEWRSKRNILAEVRKHSLVGAPSGNQIVIMLGDCALSDKKLWALLVPP